MTLVSSYVVTPNRGSEFVVLTSTCRAAEYQRSFTTLMSRSLPKVPAGMIIVMREPLARMPLMTCDGKSSETDCATGSAWNGCEPLGTESTGMCGPRSSALLTHVLSPTTAIDIEPVPVLMGYF